MLTGPPPLLPRRVTTRTFRIPGFLLTVCGLVLLCVGLRVFLTQGSQIRVTAVVLAQRCHSQFDSGDNQTEIRCDAVVSFIARGGQVIITAVTDAFAAEIKRTGQVKTIELRYDANDPWHPDKQSNYMSAGIFTLLLAVSGVALLPGAWMAARADRIAARVNKRNGLPAS
ncbi:MAG TPA: DUF3592 domain-containing protein [Streptosporangiaceae bacterium]|jgi:hypothetical protein